ncbi:MAG: Ger(x)C family spore germination protein [Clostridia bacterium]|jgi:germination protein, ger(X)C family
MKKFRNFLLRFLIFCIISILIFSLSGCYSVQSIDDLAYVVALGIDLGKNNNLELTVQLTFPNSADSSSSSGEAAPTIINSVECSSINSGISLLNSYVSKEINLSHCKVLIFSEAIASRGIGSEIYTLSNQVEIRPDCNVIISKSSAKQYITNSKPELENLVVKYYELTPYSNEYTGHITNATISNFFNALSANYGDPVAILGNGNKLSITPSNVTVNPEQEFNIVAGENPLVEYERKSENLGLAVFKQAKLVGELTAFENLLHLILTNQFESSVISIDNPYKENSAIDIALYFHKNTKINAKLVNGSPYVKSTIYLNARLLSVDKISESLTPEKIEELELLINSYLENAFLDYQYKTAKVFEADIDNVGKNLIKNFKNDNEWNNYNWPSNYKNTFFDVDVKTNIKSSFLLSS